MARVRILVRLKEGVLDPQGKAVAHALHSLAFDGVEGVRIGKLIELDLDNRLTGGARDEAVRAMCDKLLVNPVIEDYEIVEA